MSETHNNSESGKSKRFPRLRRGLSRAADGLARLSGASDHEIDQSLIEYTAAVNKDLRGIEERAVGLNKEAVQVIQAYITMPHGSSGYPRRGVTVSGPDKPYPERQWSMPMVFGLPADRAKYRYDNLHMPIDIPDVPSITIDDVTIPIHVLTLNVFAGCDGQDKLTGLPRTEIHINPILRDPDHPHKDEDNNSLFSGHVSIVMSEQGTIQQLLVGHNHTTSLVGHDKRALNGLDGAMSTILKGVRHKAFDFSNESLEAELRGLEEEQ